MTVETMPTWIARPRCETCGWVGGWSSNRRSEASAEAKAEMRLEGHKRTWHPERAGAPMSEHHRRQRWSTFTRQRRRMTETDLRLGTRTLTIEQAVAEVEELCRHRASNGPDPRFQGQLWPSEILGILALIRPAEDAQ